MNRTLEGILEGSPEHWVGDGFHVSNFFPSATDSQKRMSPFFLLDYQKPEHYPATEKKRGVGTHPHRGFETVTIAYQGAIAHKDSAGNGGVIRPGEVQWMTAGAGVLHNEFHDAAWAKRGGFLQMVQIWVNLPRKDKRSPASYQSLENQAIPEAVLPKASGVARVIAGEFEGTKGPARTFTPARMIDLRLTPGGSVRLESPKDFNTAVLVLDGFVSANGALVSEGKIALFKNDGDEVFLESRSASTVLFLSGEPIEEPLVHYGPFLMNSVDEINEAVEDFNAGRFGALAD